MNRRWELRSITTNSRQPKVANRLFSELGCEPDGVSVRLRSPAVLARRKLPFRMRTDIAGIEAGAERTCRRMPQGAPRGVYKPPFSKLTFSPFDHGRLSLHPQPFFPSPCLRNFIPIPHLYPIIPWYTSHNQQGSRRPWVSPSFAQLSATADGHAQWRRPR